jgi:hypothetical protein
MVTFLTQLAIDEVSSVDKAASPGARILLMKRDGAAPTPEEALRAAIESGFADDEIVDKAAWIEQQLKDYRDHVAKRAVAFRKGDSKVDRETENLVAFAKIAIDQGRSPGLKKSDFIAGIQKRAATIRKAGETDAQAFTRAMTEDEIGKALYRASKVASGPEVEPVPVEPRTDNLRPIGPAHARMEALAADHLKANPRKSKESAFATVYTDPRNAELREACVREQMAHSLAQTAA